MIILYNDDRTTEVAFDLKELTKYCPASLLFEKDFKSAYNENFLYNLLNNIK